VDWWGGRWNEGKEKSGGDHSGLADYVIAKSAPISARPRAASIPIPLGPEAPVTTTTLPFRENISARESVFGISIGMLRVGCVMDITLMD